MEKAPAALEGFEDGGDLRDGGDPRDGGWGGDPQDGDAAAGAAPTETYKTAVGEGVLDSGVLR